VDESRKVQLAWADGFEVCAEGVFLHFLGKESSGRTKRLTRRRKNYERKERLNQASGAREYLGRGRGCVVQVDEADKTNRRMRRHGKAGGRWRRGEKRAK
jgi:hypothetical protein